MDTIIQTLAIAALPVIFAITLHEAAHGYAARYFGDSTAWMLGRLSLNPLKHIDPVGTVVVPVLLYTLSGGAFVFGWAKPVPVNTNNLRSPKKNMLWVAGAGPAANLAMALGWTVLLKLVSGMPPHMYSLALQEMARIGIAWNVGLMVLNLLPVPPLDGGRMLVSVLPHRASMVVAQLERYGLFIVLGLVYLGWLDVLLRPVVRIVNALLIAIFRV